MNSIFTLGIVVALVVGAYFLIRIVIAAIKKQEKTQFVRGLGASVIAIVICFAGFTMTQTPEQKAATEAKIAAKKQAEEAQRIAAEKAAAEKAEIERRAAEEKRIAEEKVAVEKAEAERRAAEEKRIADQQAAERKAQEVAQKKYDAMIRDITTGWNTKTTNVDEDSHNWEKAVGLVYRYPDYIHNASDNWIDVADALKSPWKYYGQVVNLSGSIYSIEEFPPGSDIVQLFPEGCYHAMLNTGHGTQSTALYIVGSAGNVYDDAMVTVKGYIFGHSNLITGLGGKAKGLSFIGFME